MVAQLFAIGVTIVIAGVIWFHVVRPILEDFGIIRPMESVNNSGDGGGDVMSRASDSAPQNAPSSLQTRPQTASDQTDDPKARREKLIDTYRVLRKHGIRRDDARALLKMWNLPLDNNLWAQAEVPAQEPDGVTPIAGRPTNAPFRETDPALEYKPLR